MDEKKLTAILYRFNASPIKINVDVIKSIDAGNGVLTVTENTGQAHVGYHIKIE